MPSPFAAPRPRRHRGLTLVELIVSLAVMSIIFLGMAGAVMLATRAIPTGDGSAERVDGAREVIEQLVEDLRVAVHITERSASAITFTLKDRDGDGLPEVFRYSWSGVEGEPLIRTHDDVATEILADVHEFDLGYVVKDVVETYPGPLVTSSELELSSHDEATGSQDFVTSADAWTGQHLVPVLPADAVSWSVTRVVFRTQVAGLLLDSIDVQLRRADADGMPLDTVLAHRTVLETLLPPLGYAWEEFTFNDVSDLAPSDALCLVIAHASGDKSCQVEWDNDSGAGRLETSDAGATWERFDDEVMPHYLYGTVVTPGAVQSLTRHHVSTVTIGLRSGADAANLVKTSVQTLNLPEALDALWETDFNADPTLLDLDADGTPDWRVAGHFDTDSLFAGMWLADGNLDTNPSNDFNAPTTIDLRFCDVTDDGESGGIRLRVDRGGTKFGYVEARAELDSTSRQTVTILTYGASFTLVPALVVPDLDLGFIDLRLLVDPDRGTCNVLVNGVDQGTFAYGEANSVSSHACNLFETANVSGIRFDSVRVRLGGTP